MAAVSDSSDPNLMWLPLIPRNETGAFALNKRGIRGEGVTVAVFDTGVDARAPGLAFGPNGSLLTFSALDSIIIIYFNIY